MIGNNSFWSGVGRRLTLDERIGDTWFMANATYQARTLLSRFPREAEAGLEVIVMRGNKAVARIVPIRLGTPLDPPVSESAEQ